MRIPATLLLIVLFTLALIPVGDREAKAATETETASTTPTSKQKAILITGASSGIGRKTAEVLAADRESTDPAAADTAVFYSISNCQPGLSGVSFGNLLLKQVVRDLERELPGIKNFVTLSPVPGFAEWVARDSETSGLAGVERSTSDIRRLGLQYFLSAKRDDGTPVDSVARFHLRNGAELDDLIPDANPSERGQSESLGLMVSYRYDRSRIEDRHEQYTEDHSVTLSDSLAAEARTLGLL